MVLHLKPKMKPFCLLQILSCFCVQMKNLVLETMDYSISFCLINVVYHLKPKIKLFCKPEILLHFDVQMENLVLETVGYSYYLTNIASHLNLN